MGRHAMQYELHPEDAAFAQRKPEEHIPQHMKDQPKHLKIEGGSDE